MKPRDSSAETWDEQAFRLAAESLPKPVWTHNAAGRIDFVNRRFRDYFEFGLGGVTDMVNWSSVVHPVDFDRALPAISRSLACGVPYEAELRLKPSSAPETAYRLHCMKIVPVAAESDNFVTKWAGNATDIQTSDPEGMMPGERAIQDNVMDVVLNADDVVGAHRALDYIMGFVRERAGLRADYQAIRLVFFELIGNVVKYAPGRLMVRVDWFGESPYMHVFDRGGGFEYRPSLPSDILSEGGRGLYLVNSLTGSLTVHRLPGCGSHVSVRLPARRREG